MFWYLPEKVLNLFLIPNPMAMIAIPPISSIPANRNARISGNIKIRMLRKIRLAPKMKYNHPKRFVQR
jgi:hypothetical protein